MKHLTLILALMGTMALTACNSDDDEQRTDRQEQVTADGQHNVTLHRQEGQPDDEAE